MLIEDLAPPGPLFWATAWACSANVSGYRSHGGMFTSSRARLTARPSISARRTLPAKVLGLRADEDDSPGRTVRLALVNPGTARAPMSRATTLAPPGRRCPLWQGEGDASGRLCRLWSSPPPPPPMHPGGIGLAAQAEADDEDASFAATPFG